MLSKRLVHIVAAGLFAVGLSSFTASAAQAQAVVDDNPAAVSSGMGNMSVALRGPDGNLWASGWNGTTWNPWSRLGGMTLTSGPALSLRPGITDAFARGANNEIFHRYYSNGTWSAWGSIGGCASSAPAASYRSNVGSIDVVMRGCDGAIWFKTWTQSNGWSAWVTLNGSGKYAPAIKSYASGQIDIFSVNNDGSMAARSFYQGSWTGWGGLGGNFTSAPSATSEQPGRINVYGRGADNRVYQNAWLGSAWSGWIPIETLATSGPAAAAEGPGRVQLFVRGGSWLYQKQWVQSAWTNWSNDWPLAGLSAPDYYASSWRYGGANGSIDSDAEVTEALAAMLQLPLSSQLTFASSMIPGDFARVAAYVAANSAVDDVPESDTPLGLMFQEGGDPVATAGSAWKTHGCRRTEPAPYKVWTKVMLPRTPLPKAPILIGTAYSHAYFCWDKPTHRAWQMPPSVKVPHPDPDFRIDDVPWEIEQLWGPRFTYKVNNPQPYAFDGFADGGVRMSVDYDIVLCPVRVPVGCFTSDRKVETTIASYKGNARRYNRKR